MRAWGKEKEIPVGRGKRYAHTRVMRRTRFGVEVLLVGFERSDFLEVKELERESGMVRG